MHLSCHHLVQIHPQMFSSLLLLLLCFKYAFWTIQKVLMLLRDKQKWCLVVDLNLKSSSFSWQTDLLAIRQVARSWRARKFLCRSRANALEATSHLVLLWGSFVSLFLCTWQCNALHQHLWFISNFESACNFEYYEDFDSKCSKGCGTHTLVDIMNCFDLSVQITMHWQRHLIAFGTCIISIHCQTCRGSYCDSTCRIQSVSDTLIKTSKTKSPSTIM